MSLGCELGPSGITEAKSQTCVSNNGTSCNVGTGPLEWGHAFASVINLDMAVCSVAAGLRLAWTPDLEISDHNHHTHHCECDFKDKTRRNGVNRNVSNILAAQLTSAGATNVS